MQVTAKVSGAKVSLKNSLSVCSAIRGQRVSTAKKLLQNLVDKKEPLEGKYYQSTSQEILNLVKSLESNARQKNADLEKLYIRIAKADKGYKFIRPKSRAKFRGRQAKITNIELVAEER